MPASISTRLDEQEFLELSDYYYVTARSETTDHVSTGSSTTLSTNHTNLRRRATTAGPRWRPSTLIECDDTGRASGDMDAAHKSDLVEGQALPRFVIGPRKGLLASSNSMLLDYDSDDTQSFRTAKENVPTARTLNAVPSHILDQNNSAVRFGPSSSAKIPRPLSTASAAPGSCFGIFSFPKWNTRGFYHLSGIPGFRPRKQKKAEVTQPSKREIDLAGDHDFSIISFDTNRSVEGRFASLPLASASSLFVGLDYDYHLAVEVLINEFDINVVSTP